MILIPTKEVSNTLMNMQDIIDEIRLELTGDLLDMEIEDTTIERTVKKALRELERYWDETTIINVPYASCIDYSTCEEFKEHVSSIVKIYRTTAVGAVETDSGQYSTATLDPMYMQQWMIFSNAGTMYNLQDYVLNYSAWTTLSQIRNTISTELAFEEDRHNHKIYINNALSTASVVAIKYIPKLTSVEDIKSDYWIDILIRLSVAYVKTVLGRIRTRFTQTNALWTQDGDKMLEEGNTELKELRELLRTNANMIYLTD